MQKISIEALPVLSSADVSRVIEAIPPELLQKKLLESENKRMSIDLDKGKIILRDDVTNRILLDGSTGKFRISKVGIDVEKAKAEELVFDSDYGQTLETYYLVTDHRWMTATNWIFAGPWNPNVGRYEPMPITLNSKDFIGVKVYFEVVLGGPKAVTSHARLFNITRDIAVPNSAISFTPSFGEDSNPIRSSEIQIDEGSNVYACQQKRSGGTSSDYPSVIRAQVVARIKT